MWLTSEPMIFMKTLCDPHVFRQDCARWGRRCSDGEAESLREPQGGVSNQPGLEEVMAELSPEG